MHDLSGIATDDITQKLTSTYTENAAFLCLYACLRVRVRVCCLSLKIEEIEPLLYISITISLDCTMLFWNRSQGF